MYSSLMKKTLRTLFIVILLIGVGSLYVVKFPDSVVSQKILNAIGGQVVTDATVSTGIDLTNCSSYFDGCNTCFVQSWVVGGCTRMYCATPTEPKCLQYTTGTREQGQGTSDQGPGLDLTNCVSYFDGCNNCTVKDGKPEACTLMYCETPTEPKCNQYGSGNEITETELTGSEITTAITTDQWYIKQAYTSWTNNYIKIDYTEDGPQWPGWAPEIINNNPLIRTFEVASTAIFEILKLNNGWPEPMAVQRNEFKLRGNSNRATLNPDHNNPIYYGASDTSIVKIDHDSQKVYKITETYRP